MRVKSSVLITLVFMLLASLLMPRYSQAMRQCSKAFTGRYALLETYGTEMQVYSVSDGTHGAKYDPKGGDPIQVLCEDEPSGARYFARDVSIDCSSGCHQCEGSGHRVNIECGGQGDMYVKAIVCDPMNRDGSDFIVHESSDCQRHLS